MTKRLSDVGRLARDFVDEAHLVSLDSTFCDDLVHLRFVLQSLPCPLLLLTARMPPKLCNTVFAAAGVTTERPVSIVRPLSTRREDTRYTVERSLAPLNRRPTHVAGWGSGPLHHAVALRVLRQAASVRNAGGDKVGRSIVLGVSCETVVEVDGMVKHMHAQLTALAFADSTASLSASDVDVVVILNFHSEGAAPDGNTRADAGGASPGPSAGGGVREQELEACYHSAAVERVVATKKARTNTP